MPPTQLLSLISQTFLKVFGYYKGALDNKWGPVSKQAAARWYSARKSSLPDVAATEGVIRILAAQCLLADMGFYSGAIDGQWGPLSEAAATQWASDQPCWIEKPKAVQDDSRLSLAYDVAKLFLGTREIPGKDHNPIIVRWLRRLATWITDDETAWCSAFVNHCASDARCESSGKLNARSWLDVGEVVPLSEARKGDVVVLWRGCKDSWTGHVAFLDHYNPARGLVYLLGGNQNNEVNITAYPAGRVLGVRRLRSLDALQTA